MNPAVPEMGLLAYGSYLPHHRLRRDAIAAALGGAAGRGTRAVASYDEDTTSMGVEAARRALGATAASSVRRLLFSTADPPYLDKTNANVVHAALGLEADVLAIDVVGSVRSGIGAFVLASESTATSLAVLADIRTGLPGSADEREGGDAAAAFLFGRGTPIAEVVGHASTTEELLERWRLPGERASRTWEERFGEHALVPLADAAWDRALCKAGLTPADLDTVVVTGTHARAVGAFTRAAGVVDGAAELHEVVGNTGTAHAGLALAHVLDQATPGQRIGLVAIADGATAIVLRTTEEVLHRGQAPSVGEQLAGGDDTLPYARFLSWRGYLAKDPPRRPDPTGPAAPPSLRNQRHKYGFIGRRCGDCGTLHTSAVRVCITCKAIDRMIDQPMADLYGTVATYTIDHLAYSPSPPIVAAVVDLDGGGRFSCQLTDVDPRAVRIGDRVEMTFRRLTTAGGVHNYFWKARPVLPHRGESR